MTTLSLTKTPLSEVKADAIVVGVVKGAAGVELAPGAGDVGKAFKRRLLPALTALGAKGTAEGSYMTAPAAIASAVEDALAPFGASILEVPITPVMVHRLVSTRLA